MADINVERKGPSIWPWIVGLLVLALLIWAIAEMVDRGEPTDEVVIEQVEPDVPAPAVPAPTPAPAEARPLQELLPLGPEDDGQQVQVSGQVVGEPAQQGFWVRAADDNVIFVQSPRQVERGQSVQIQGMLHQAQPDQASTWLDQSQLRQDTDFQRYTMHQNMYVMETQAGMQQQPGMQQPGTQQQPGQQTQPGAPSN